MSRPAAGDPAPIGPQGAENQTPAGAEGARAGARCCGRSTPSRGEVELVGLVVNLDGHLAELVAVGTSVVEAEQQFAAAGKNNADIGLRAAAVTAVGCRQSWGRWGNGSCHAYLQRLVARKPSGPLLPLIVPVYACSTGIQAFLGRENAHRHRTF